MKTSTPKGNPMNPANQLFTSITSILLAIVGVAALAVLVGSNAQTSKVVEATGGAFAKSLNAATLPVRGR